MEKDHISMSGVVQVMYCENQLGLARPSLVEPMLHVRQEFMFVGESGENRDIIFSYSLSAHSLISCILSVCANCL